jgi:hypothetical protein
MLGKRQAALIQFEWPLLLAAAPKHQTALELCAFGTFAGHSVRAQVLSADGLG